MQFEIERIGGEIFARMAEARPSVFSQSNLTGLLLGWSMRKEDLKTQLFRLVDVLPALTSHSEIARHIREYLGNESAGLSAGARRVLNWAPRVAALSGPMADLAVRRMARAFILAERPEAALDKLQAMRDRSIGFTVDLLGETAVSEREAEAYGRRYFELINVLADAAASWARSENLDSNDRGELPAVNVSVKISALYSQIKPEAPEDGIERLCERLRPLLRSAKERNVFVNFDMEVHSLKNLTLR